MKPKKTYRNLYKTYKTHIKTYITHVNTYIKFIQTYKHGQIERLLPGGGDRETGDQTCGRAMRAIRIRKKCAEVHNPDDH